MKDITSESQISIWRFGSVHHHAVWHWPVNWSKETIYWLWNDEDESWGHWEFHCLVFDANCERPHLEYSIAKQNCFLTASINMFVIQFHMSTVSMISMTLVPVDLQIIEWSLASLRRRRESMLGKTTTYWNLHGAQGKWAVLYNLLDI